MCFFADLSCTPDPFRLLYCLILDPTQASACPMCVAVEIRDKTQRNESNENVHHH